MSLTRLPFWETRLLPAFTKEREKVPFQWGEQDCCLIAADAINAITGTDIAADSFRGLYHDEASAFALIKSVTGGTTVADAAAYCANKHGLTEWTHPLLAKRGDLVVVENADRLIAGFVDLSGAFVRSAGANGLIRLPLTAVKRAWQV